MSAKPKVQSSDPVRKRVVATMLVCLGLCGLVVSRAAYIQIIGDPRLERLGKKQFQSKFLIRPRRGLIVDRNGEPLAVNAEAQSLAGNPGKITNKRMLARLLSKSLDVPVQKVLDRLVEKREFAWIKRHLSEVDMAKLKRYGLIDAEGDLASGLWLVKESKRVRPHGELASHVLGDVNLDTEGLEGVELWNNDRLRGQVVSIAAIKDALGRPTFIDAVAARDVRDGQNVQLTLDASLQFSVEQELAASVSRTGARSGTVVVMNPENGEILALANFPTFNPNQKGAATALRRNRALTDGFEPGSTLKPILLAGALSRGWKLSDQLDAEQGSIEVQGKRISEAEAHEKFGMISLRKMIQVSSNVAAAKLAMKLGPDAVLGALDNFGFGTKSGSGFPGEISGMIPPRKQAVRPLTLANLGFGQGLLVTPLQMIRAYAAIANGGFLVQPTFIRREGDPVPPRRILPARVAESVQQALRSVTEEGGTGLKARLEGYEIAGKTGTAQVVDPATGRYSSTRYISSFIGFPVRTHPSVLVFASLDEPKGAQYYASDIAAPLFRSVMAAVVARFSLPTTIEIPAGPAMAPPSSPTQQQFLNDRLRMTLAQASGPNETEEPSAKPIQWHGLTPSGAVIWKMPPLSGLTAREVLQLLQGRRYRLEVVGTGVVQSQMPGDGSLVADGSKIKLVLGDP